MARLKETWQADESIQSYLIMTHLPDPIRVAVCPSMAALTLLTVLLLADTVDPRARLIGGTYQPIQA